MVQELITGPSAYLNTNRNISDLSHHESDVCQMQISCMRRSRNKLLKDKNTFLIMLYIQVIVKENKYFVFKVIDKHKHVL
jgi:hypothetical protein